MLQSDGYVINCDISKTLQLPRTCFSERKNCQQAYILALDKFDFPNFNLKERRKIHLAFEILCHPTLMFLAVKGATQFKFKNGDPDIQTFMIINGETKQLKQVIEKKFSLIDSVDQFGRTLLYRAVKYENTELVEYLISLGADVNTKQNYGSSALHCASFYAKHEIAWYLLLGGADYLIQNNSFISPKQEACDANMLQLFEVFNSSPYYHFICNFRYQCPNLKVSFAKNYEDNSLIAIYIKNPYLQSYPTIIKQQFFHGTKLKNVISIFKNGFLQPGEITPEGKEILINSDHIECNITVQEQENFAQAVFISKSPFYADNYSEKVQFCETQWSVLLHCSCPHYLDLKHFEHTLTEYSFRIDETQNVETRVDKNTQLIQVLGVYFIEDQQLQSFQKVQDFKALLTPKNLTTETQFFQNFCQNNYKK